MRAKNKTTPLISRAGERTQRTQPGQVNLTTGDWRDATRASGEPRKRWKRFRTTTLSPPLPSPLSSSTNHSPLRIVTSRGRDQGSVSSLAGRLARRCGGGGGGSATDRLSPVRNRRHGRMKISA